MDHCYKRRVGACVHRLLVLDIVCVLHAGEPPAKTQPTAADVAFAAAQAAYKKKDFPDARTLLQTFTTKFSTDTRVPQALFLKGMCEMGSKQASAALNTWNWLLANHARSDAAADAMEQIALHYESNGQMNKVEEMIDKLVANFPAHPATVRLCTKRGEALFETKKYAEAVKVLEKVEKQLKPAILNKLSVAKSMLSAAGKPQALLEEANGKLESNETDAATALYERYIKEFPKGTGVAEAKTKLGWCLSLTNKKEKLERAEALWKEVIQQGKTDDPWVGESQWNMIRLLAGPNGEWEDAVKLCETVAKNFPNQFRSEQALFTRAWLYWAHKKWKPAKAGFDDLIRAYPDNANHPPIIEYLKQCDDGIASEAKATKP